MATHNGLCLARHCSVAFSPVESFETQSPAELARITAISACLRWHAFCLIDCTRSLALT